MSSDPVISGKYLDGLYRLNASQTRARLAEALQLVKSKPKDPNAVLTVIRVERDLLAAARFVIQQLQIESIDSQENQDDRDHHPLPIASTYRDRA